MRGYFKIHGEGIQNISWGGDPPPSLAVKGLWLAPTYSIQLNLIDSGIDAKTPSVTSTPSSDTQFVRTLKAEYKLQQRKHKTSLDCRMCQRKVPVVLCVNLRGEVFCYHMQSKRFRKLDRFPHLWQPSQLVVNEDVVYATGGALKVSTTNLILLGTFCWELCWGGTWLI